jgi:hypothetical protein
VAFPPVEHDVTTLLPCVWQSSGFLKFADSVGHVSKVAQSYEMSKKRMKCFFWIDLPAYCRYHRSMMKQRSYKSSYLVKFFAEKDLPDVQWELEDRRGVTHWISNAVVIEAIFQAPKHEQKQIGDMLRRLDFANADINDYLKHLAGALINRGA